MMLKTFHETFAANLQMERERNKLLRMEVEWTKLSYLEDMSEPSSIQQLVKALPRGLQEL